MRIYGEGASIFCAHVVGVITHKMKLYIKLMVFFSGFYSFLFRYRVVYIYEVNIYQLTFNANVAVKKTQIYTEVLFVSLYITHCMHIILSIYNAIVTVFPFKPNSVCLCFFFLFV